MNISEVSRKAEENGMYFKPKSGQPVRLKILNDDFKENIFTGKDGKTSVRYEGEVMVEGIEGKKILSLGARTWEKFFQRATNRGKAITDLTFVLTRTGEGLATKWDIDAMDGIVVSAPSMPMPEDKVPW